MLIRMKQLAECSGGYLPSGFQDFSLRTEDVYEVAQFTLGDKELTRVSFCTPEDFREVTIAGTCVVDVTNTLNSASNK